MLYAKLLESSPTENKYGIDALAYALKNLNQAGAPELDALLKAIKSKARYGRIGKLASDLLEKRAEERAEAAG